MPRRTSALARVSLAAGLAGLTACAADPNATTTTVDGAGGLARSHDGLFTLEVPPGALSQAVDLTITTRRDVLASELDSLIYEVTPAGLTFAQPARAQYQAPYTPWVGRRTLATFDGGRPEELPAAGVRYDHLEHRARGEVRALDARLFGLARRIEPGACTACGQLCGGCDASRPGCSPDPDGPTCDGAGQCLTAPTTCPAHGWDAAPGAATAYVINMLAIAPARVGYDLDGACRGAGDCADNALAGFGDVANDQIRQGLLGGETLLLLELAGLDHPGDLVSDGSLTVKLYRGRDADEPFFPANNFSIPTGDTTCCEFVIATESLAGTPPQALGRIPARLGEGRVIARASGTGATLNYPLLFVPYQEDPPPMEPVGVGLYDARISLRITGSSLEDGLLGGVLLASELGRAPGPSCELHGAFCPQRAIGGSMLDFIHALVGPPDIDRDGDGLERFEVGTEGGIEECFDGNGGRVPPMIPGQPSSCTSDPRIADGYSLAYTFSAVPATIRGSGR